MVAPGYPRTSRVNAILGSGKGKAEYAKNLQVNSSFVSYAVHAHVEATQRYARGVPVSPAVRDRYLQRIGDGETPTPPTTGAASPAAPPSC